jgi:hypothetical protein
VRAASQQTGPQAPMQGLLSFLMGSGQ